jgi:hypothetical protein
MVAGMTREELISGLIRIGEKELTGEDEAEVDDYFAPEFRFHGPDGREWDSKGLKDYFAALRAAFDDLSITRGIVVVEGQFRGVPDDDHRNIRARVQPLTRWVVATKRESRRVRVDQHLPLRRNRAHCRGVDQTDNRSVLRRLGAAAASTEA